MFINISYATLAPIVSTDGGRIAVRHLLENIKYSNDGAYLRIIHETKDLAGFDSEDSVTLSSATAVADQVLGYDPVTRMIKTIKDRLQFIGYLEPGTTFGDMGNREMYRRCDNPREFVRAARHKWVDWLQNEATLKGTGALDIGDGKRCCLGHGCAALGIEGKWIGERVHYLEEYSFAPERLVGMLGLHDCTGMIPDLAGSDFPERKTAHSLSALNDHTEYTPQMIGAYLESVIDGGQNTPFVALNLYPEFNS